jgi:hypothetical protein
VGIRVFPFSFAFVGLDLVIVGAYFAGVLSLDEGFQISEIRAPKAAVLLNPGVDGAERLGIELINAVAAFAVLADEMSAAQQAQMLGNGGTGDWESAGNLSRWLAAAAEKIEHRAARGVGEGLEGGFGSSGGSGGIIRN